MSGLLKLKYQAKAVLAKSEFKQSTEPEAEQSPEAEIKAEDLANALEALGINAPKGSTETEQLRLLLAKVNTKILALYGPSELTGKDLLTAGRQQEKVGKGWAVTLSFSREGGEKFASLTQSLAGTGRVMGIILDDRSISDVNIGPQFKAAGITGLRGGSLPLPVKVIEQRTIGATLGTENVRRSLVASLSGLALVAVFMVVVYRLAGAVSVVALALYALFNLAMYSLIPVTLSLPGIAGFILSIGMAVDANVLIFERVKEELREGNTLVRSIDTGFSLAFSSIIDGHVTGLISCIALFALGTGLVKGFAVTLAIGLLLSLFTALTCTRTILRVLMSYSALRQPTYFLPATQLPAEAAP